LDEIKPSKSTRTAFIKLPPGYQLPGGKDRYLPGLIVKIITNSGKKKAFSKSKNSSSENNLTAAACQVIFVVI
jgi:hypothetical protein